MAELSYDELFFSDAIKTLQFPVKLQILEDLVSKNPKQSLDSGDIITIYGYDKQLVLAAGSQCSSASYENVDSMDNTSSEYVPMEKQKNVYIPKNCGEKLKDLHCDGKKFQTVEKVIENLPHYLKSERDFFTIYADENEGMTKVQKGQVLEFVRIVDIGNPGAYRNVTKNSKTDLLIYSLQGKEIVLTEKNLPDLIGVNNPNEYSIQSFENFSLPRRMQFVNSDLQTYLEQFTDTTDPLAMDFTSNERLFFTTKTKEPWIDIENNIMCIENVPVLYIDERKQKRVKVRVIKDESIKNAFFMLFAKETDIKEGKMKTYDLYGRVQKLSDKTSTKKEAIKDAEGVKNQTGSSKPNDMTTSPKTQKSGNKEKYEYIYPNTTKADNTLNAASKTEKLTKSSAYINPAHTSSVAKHPAGNPDPESHSTGEHPSRPHVIVKSSSFPAETQHQGLPDNEILVTKPNCTRAPGPDYHSAQNKDFSKTSSRSFGDEKDDVDERYSAFPTKQMQRSKSLPVKHLRDVPPPPMEEILYSQKEEQEVHDSRFRQPTNDEIQNTKNAYSPTNEGSQSLPGKHLRKVPPPPKEELLYSQKEEQEVHDSRFRQPTNDETQNTKNVCSSTNEGSPSNRDVQTGQATSVKANDEKQGYTSTDITGDIKDMSVNQLCLCLEICGLGKLSKVCKDEKIDGKFLFELEEEDLKADPFLMKTYELKKLKMIKEGYRPKID